MKCPICDHENSEKMFFDKDECKAICPQCEVDLESISLLSRMNEGVSIPLNKSSKLLFSLLLSIPIIIIISILFFVCVRNLSLHDASVKKNELLDARINKIQDESRLKNNTFLQEKKDLNAKLEILSQQLKENKLHYEESIRENTQKLEIVKKENGGYKARIKAINQDQNVATQMVYFNGRDSPWSFSSKVYGHGRYFPLLFKLNPRLMSSNNRPQFLRIILNSKQVGRIYKKTIYISKSKKAFYNYTTREKDSLSKITQKFKGVLYGGRKTIVKLNEKIIFSNKTLKSGQKIILQFK